MKKECPILELVRIIVSLRFALIGEYHLSITFLIFLNLLEVGVLSQFVCHDCWIFLLFSFINLCVADFNIMSDRGNDMACLAALSALS